VCAHHQTTHKMNGATLQPSQAERDSNSVLFALQQSDECRHLVALLSKPIQSLHIFSNSLFLPRFLSRYVLEAPNQLLIVTNRSFERDKTCLCLSDIQRLSPRHLIQCFHTANR
jgi:hypothetical protein